MVLVATSRYEEFFAELNSGLKFHLKHFFWQTSGYFDSAAELKPLLHTWSLAVEEQYYLLFPIFFILCWQLGKRWVLFALIVISFSSLALAQWASSVAPVAAFYLLPTRVWELLIGAFVAFYFSSKKPQQPPRAIAELGGLIGILLLGYSIFSFNSHTPFPSLHTLVPTIGAALIILFSSPFTCVGLLLGSRLLVGIGLISYSAYLWHQPLLAFARYRKFNELNQISYGLLLIISFIAAYFTWKFIEVPFRNKNLFSRKSIFIYGFLVSLIFATFGAIGHLHNGFRNRLTDNQAHILRYEEPSYTQKVLKDTYRMGDCFLKDAQDSRNFSENCQALSSHDSVLIWGDSHAAALSYGLRTLFPNVIQYTASGCPP
jgi:peptidoglycan/LPS O-acetylase OafA/YrhL